MTAEDGGHPGVQDADEGKLADRASGCFSWSCSLARSPWVPHIGAVRLTPAQRAAALDAQLRCPSCDDVSVANSSAASAVAIRQLVLADTNAGESDQAIVDVPAEPLPGNRAPAVYERTRGNRLVRTSGRIRSGRSADRETLLAQTVATSRCPAQRRGPVACRRCTPQIRGKPVSRVQTRDQDLEDLQTERDFLLRSLQDLEEEHLRRGRLRRGLFETPRLLYGACGGCIALDSHGREVGP